MTNPNPARHSPVTAGPPRRSQRQSQHRIQRPKGTRRPGRRRSNHPTVTNAGANNRQPRRAAEPTIGGCPTHTSQIDPAAFDTFNLVPRSPTARFGGTPQMAEVLTPPTTTSTHTAANLAPVTARPTALSPSAPPSPQQHTPAPTPEPPEQPGPAARGHFRQRNTLEPPRCSGSRSGYLPWQAADKNA